ncbi:RHS repeat-associated core domain-containing protein [Myroides sp. DF42-4-2]|uniref:RHS repeat domain-containing protein n=1 Tax=Myroides sp. DF42-4-2 TaxID=2746726 RepID=UPI002576EE3C|nr:RHS repeat-associated core domain-containing protein [Myroides sp. DF42-4-2]MDM1409037.1 RHS repeat-associated core domain-containing protein [Myroides sp. DF42-4-2]
MIRSVLSPDKVYVQFEYDALGRRTAKIVGDTIYRYIWDGDVLLHEWHYKVNERPTLVVNEESDLAYDREEPTDNLVTWVYSHGYTPIAKIVDGQRYSIISDYIGRPVQAFDDRGAKVWSTDYDIYGRLRNLEGDRQFIPFRQLGQYEDIELNGLYYNRFRYYDSSTGLYISKDPIGLAGNNPTMYAYVWDSNAMVDVFGLSTIDPLELIEKINTAIRADSKIHSTKHLNAVSDAHAKELSIGKKGGLAEASYLQVFKNKKDIIILEKQGAIDAINKGDYFQKSNNNYHFIYEHHTDVGFNNGKKTRFMRIEYSSGFMHSHPISEADARKYKKDIQKGKYK